MSNIDQFAMVLDFHRKFGAHIGDKPTIPPKEVVDLRLRLIREELGELMSALTGFDCEVVIRAKSPDWHQPDIEEAADALADLSYVVQGTAVSCGIDLRPIFAEVHRTNMAKVGGGADARGKIQKPPGWQPPNLAPLLEGMSLTALDEANGKLLAAKATNPKVRVRLNNPTSMLHNDTGNLGEFDGERWTVSFSPCLYGRYYATSLTVVTDEGKA